MSTTKLKVMTLIGTRPDIIKLSAVIRELDRTTDHVLVHTGQNHDYELNEIFFEDLGLRKPNHFLDAAGENAAATVANVIQKVDDVLEKEHPDAFLVLGDTNSAMGTYAAKRRKIPIFHMEAGNRSFDARVPEEVNRRILDHMSDINMVYSDVTRHNLLREGLPMDRILKTGSPTYEALMAHMPKIEASPVLEELALTEKNYFVLSAHREENLDIPDNFNRLVTVLERLCAEYDLPVIFSAHPRTRKRFEEQNVVLPARVRMMKPLSFSAYVKLQMHALCVLSDSGTISEESSILNFPAVNIREAHERLEAMDEGSVIMSGLNPERVLQSVALTVTQSRGAEREFRLPSDYSYPNVSKKVVRMIMSYTDYVNRQVWRK